MSSLLYLYCLGLGLLVLRLASNHVRLRNIPGPWLASFSDLWRAYHQYRGQLRDKLLELHMVHGAVVRYGICSVSINDPSAIDIIYGSRVGYTTAPSYGVLIGIADGKEVPSLVSTSDEGKHGRLRRSIANGFTPTAVIDYEPQMDQTIAELLDLLSQRTSIDLSEWMMYYAMDAAARMVFSDSGGCMATGSDNGGTIQLIRNRFNHWGWWSSLPDLERLVYRNPIAMRRKRAPSAMAAAAVKKIRERKSSPTLNQRDLLQKFLDASESNPDILDPTSVVGLLMSTISGAGDTTSTTVTAIIYQLLKNPTELDKLVVELHENNLSGIPSHTETSKLPFLNAVIKESMRVYSTPTWPMERCVPAGGATIAGTFLPEGISVGCMPQALHQNTAIFGKDALMFRPNRWLDADKDQLRAMDSAHIGFSRGRRACLGQHIAVLQMRKVITALVMKFRFTLVEPNAKLDADLSPAVACLKPLWVEIKEI